MVLLSNLFFRSHTGSYVNQEILEFVGSFDDAVKFNWCKLVVKGLRDASTAWLQDPIEQYYTGSLVFLIYFYLEKVENDLIKAEKTRPSFIGWKNSIILQREATEDVDNSFGQGIIKADCEELDNSQDDGGTKNIGEQETEQVEDLKGQCKEKVEADRNKTSTSNSMPASLLPSGGFSIEIGGDVRTTLGKNSIPHQQALVPPDVKVSTKTTTTTAGVEHVLSRDDKKTTEMSLVTSQHFHTPMETIKGVDDLFQMGSTNQTVDIAIMSVARDISADYVDEDFIKEYETMQLIKEELKQMETLKTSCCNNLKIARALFPSNSELEKLEEQFERLHQFSGIKKPPATVDKSCERNDLENAKSNINQMNVGQRPRREMKIGEFQKSPFRQRTIDIDKLKLSKVEEDTWCWLNANSFLPLQQIFSWNGHYICLKQQFQSLRDGCQIYTAVVDTFTCVLNDDERFRSLDSPRRFFCNTYTTLNTMTRTNEINPPHNEKDHDCLSSSEMKYKRFCSNFNEVLAQFSVSISNVDLVFFPIHYINHFYVVCFDLKNPAIEILDNNCLGDSITSIYDGYPQSLKENFVKYMMNVSEVKARHLLNVEITRLQMKWRTTNNSIDCGIFAMRHMETYKGNGVRSWDSKFAPETQKQIQARQIHKARQLYAHKIISSTANSLRNQMQLDINCTLARN
ncbi:hypothetical protein DCAR_0312389 [Daucus carota subsp. sativus]|uniref:Ubiquitin-like protease family profile domain-containing protein n=1 Tax=Daucus carota subsp. sativus TaxID=79200 RepID=A0AAF0WRE3_DAUCS|nr:PREDICTED: uncharacterized protein LOC108211942 isoform X2 [Daucus carota subsp. sativus]WOG93108.1 hypothetical protein DCAR_0312389 [Daucus carota subsp. sativus]